MAEAIITDVLARISADASNFVRNMNQAAGVADDFRESLGQTGNALGGTGAQLQNFSGSAGVAHKSLMALGAISAIVGGAVIGFGVKSFRAAAQVNEMDVAMRAVGNSTGLGYTAMRTATLAVQDNGIEMAAAQQMVLLYAKAQLNLADSSKVARVAQDLAVLSGANSTDTAMRLTYAIMNQDTLMLRHLGITKTASQAFEEYAQANNTSAKSLTEFEKKQAITNMVIAEGAKVNGVYEAAMKEPAKVLRSFPRLFNEVQVAVGQGLTQAFGPLILASYKMVGAFTTLVREGGALEPMVDAIGRAFTYMVAPIVAGMQAFGKFLTTMQTISKAANAYRERIVGVVGASNEMEIKTRALAETMSRFIPIIAAVTTALSIFFGQGILRQVPVIGALVGGINPLVGALVALLLTTPPLQQAFANLFKAFLPLKDLGMQLAQTLGGVLMGAVAVLVSIINGLAKVISYVTGWISRNTEIVYALAVGLGVAVIAYQLFTNWTKITTAVTTALSKAFLFLATKISFPLIAIGLLVAAFVFLWRTSETFRNVITQVIDQVAKTIGAGVAFVLNTFAGLLEGFASLMGTGGAFRDIFILVFNSVIKVVGTIIAGVIKFFAELIGAFGTLVESSDGMRKGIIGVFSSIMKFIQSVVVFVIESLSNWVGLFAGILESVGEFGKGMSEGFNKLGQVVSDFAKGALKILGKLLTGVYNAAREFVSSLVNAIKGVFTGGNNAAEQASNSIGNYTNTVFQFASAGASALRGVQKWLQSTADKIASINVTNVATSLVDGLAKASTGAKNALNGVADRILEFANKDWGTGIANTAVRAATVAAEWLRGAASKVLDFTQEGFTKNLTEGISGFLDLVDGMFTNLKGTVGNEAETIFDPINDAMDGIADGAEGASKRAADRLKRITDAAKSALQEIQKQAQQVLEFSDNVRKGINDFGSIASLSPEQGVPVTANMIIDNMRQRLAKITKFGTDLRALAGLGLNNASLQELIQAGPIAGGTMAAALLKEGQSAVSQVNTFQGGIDLAGSAIGDIASRSQFGMGTQEAQAIVNTKIEVKEGAVQIVFGSDLSNESRASIKEIVNGAISQAMDDLARELANQRA